MRIAITTVQDGPFVRVWSGTPAYLAAALERTPGVEVQVFRPPAPTAYRVLNALSGVSGRLRAKLNWEVEPRVLAHFMGRLRRQWGDEPPDVLVAMGWMPMGREAGDPPTLFWGDAAISQRVDRAPHWSRLSPRTRRLAALTESLALRSVDGVIMPSRWAVESLEREHPHGLPPVHLVPFGSNVDDPGPRTRTRRAAGIRLLAVGVEWHRKGLDRAVQTVDELRARGVEAHLDVVGSSPPSDDWLREHVTYHGFLSKADPEQAARLRALYEEDDLLLLASRSDPSPMVIGEAGAYSMPVVASGVDGVPERLSRGGVVMDPDATPSDYADAVQRVCAPGDYERFAALSRTDYEERSDWAASARRLAEVCAQVLASRAPGTD